MSWYGYSYHNIRADLHRHGIGPLMNILYMQIIPINHAFMLTLKVSLILYTKE